MLFESFNNNLGEAKLVLILILMEYALWEVGHFTKAFRVDES